MRYRSPKHLGFTLPELMVSMVIAALVMTMALNIYIDMKKQYTRLNEKHQINTKQMTVKQLIYNVIGSSGFESKYGDLFQRFVDNSGDNFGDIFGKRSLLTIGKMPIEDAMSLPDGMRLSPELCLDRKDGQKYLNIDKQINCIQENTDYIMVQHASISTLLKTNSSNNIFKIDNFQKDRLPDSDIKLNDYIVLCNAYECELEKVAGVLGDFVTTGMRVDDRFKIGDYVGKYQLDILYVADSGDKDKKGNTIYSLYDYVQQGSGDGMSYELVHGVSDIKIEYALTSEITNGQIDINWHKIDKESINAGNGKVAALKVSFDVADNYFSKIFLVNAE